MKKLFSLIAVLVSLAAFGQDSTKAQITLPARHHAYIIAFMGDRGDVEKIRYVNQVASALDTTLSDSLQREQLITVNVSDDLVTSLYMNIGSQQERLTTVYNEEIRQELFRQIGDSTKPTYRPGLVERLMEIARRNFSETEQMVHYGFNYIISIKQ